MASLGNCISWLAHRPSRTRIFSFSGTSIVIQLPQVLRSVDAFLLGVWLLGVTPRSHPFPERVATVFERYNIVSDRNLREAAVKT
jgi:hypothetical protein